jgi:Uma2 family endonuclease
MLQHVNGSKDPQRRRATYEDLLAVPDHLVAEIIDGELYTFPRPAPRHALAESVLGAILIPPFHLGTTGPGGWWILAEPELHFDEDVLVPDVAGWRRERLPVLLPETHNPKQEPKFLTLAPDWICEVLSPSTVRIDRSKKLRIYAREGVRHAWFVDALARRVEIYSLQGTELKMCATHHEDERIRAVPFEALEIPLAHLWGETPAPVPSERSTSNA